MNPFAISCLLILLTTLPLGYFVYAQNKDRSANRLWLLYSIAISVWGLFGMLIALTSDPSKALLFWRITMGLGVIWMPVLMYHFLYVYVPWQEKKLLVGAYVITALLAFSTTTPYFISRIDWVFDSFFYARPGITFYIMTIWWFALTGYTHTKLYKSSKTMPRERQNQIKYFLIASLIGYLGGFHDFSISYGNTIYPWGNYLVVVYPFIMAYAIVRHGLFDIFIFVRKTFFLVVLVVAITWGIIGVGALNTFFISNFGLKVWMVPLLAGVIALYIGYLFTESSHKAKLAKQQFITIAAHKLRKPLTHIRYIAEELKLPKTQQERDSLVANLKESNDLLIDLVNKLLEVTNLETKLEKYKFGPIDLSLMTKDIVERNIKIARNRGLSLGVNIDPALPLAEGYKKNTQFAIQALIENAIYYTQSGGNIEINLSTDNNYITWSIKDSGIGIPKGDIDKIFDKFFRGEDALKAETEGTGLALFMSRILIKRQGGELRVASDGPGKGSHFWFTLPVHTG